MVRSANAIINPELLIWGRETIGYDLATAAKKIGVDPERLAKWENGDEDDHPTVKGLFKIANVYKRPFAAFYFSKPPTYWDEPYDKLEDWRTLPDKEFGKKPPGLVLELREAARRREILLYLAEVMDEKVPTFDFVCQQDETPASLASRIRILLGITVEEQKKFKTSRIALRLWRIALERIGILVFQTGFFGGHFPVRVKDMRGTALHFDQFPIIVVNSKDSENGRIFTLFHELCHLVLGQSGLSNFYDFEGPNLDEVYCNAFAGEFLVPTSNLLAEPIVEAHRGKVWDDSDLEKLSKLYCVSKEVILRRLLDNNRTSQAHYAEKTANWKEEWQRQERITDKPPGWARHHTKYVRCHGARFVSTVLDAYDQDIIHANQLSEFLNTKFKHIEDIRTNLARELE